MKKQKNKSNVELEEGVLAVIRQSKWCLYIGTWGWGGCIIMMLFFLLAPDHIFTDPDGRVLACLPLVLMQIMAVCFLIMWLNWKIEVREDEFTFTNSFKKKKTYKFEEIEERQLSACYRYYHNGKHIVGISLLLENCYALSDAIFAYKVK